MSKSHNHSHKKNPLAADLVAPLVPELGEEYIDIELDGSEGAFVDPFSAEAEELSLVEKAIAEGKRNDDEDDYGQTVFNNQPPNKTFNYPNNYSGNSITGVDEAEYTVNSYHFSKLAREIEHLKHMTNQSRNE